MNQNGVRLAYLCAVLNATIIGFSFLFTKVALEQASPIDTLAFRFAASFAVMSLPVALGWVKVNYRGKPLFKALLLGALYPLGFFTLQTFGLQHATSAEGGILFAFTPVVTMLLAYVFLKEVTTLVQKASIFLSVFGVVFIFVMKGGGIDFSNLQGLSMLLLSCLAAGGYNVMARSLTRTFTPAEISYLLLGIGFVTFLLSSLAEHMHAGTMDRFFQPLSNGAFLLAILYLGIMSSLVTALATNYALSKIESSRMSVFSNLSTVVSIATGAVLLGEEITYYHLIGSALIIVGVLGTNWRKQSKTTVRLPGADRVEAS